MAAALASAALAQPEPGWRTDTQPMAPKSSDQDGRGGAIRVTNGLGRCQARKHPGPAMAMLALPLADKEQDLAVRKMFNWTEPCMGLSDGELGFRTILIAGPMAEQLIVDHKPRIDLATALSNTVPVAPRNVLEEVGDCLIGRDSANVAALLLADPTSQIELARVVALKPAIADCLPPSRTFTLSVPVVRALVAVSAYRRLVVAPS